MLINGEMQTRPLSFDNIFRILIKIVLFYKQEVPSWQQKLVKKDPEWYLTGGSNSILAICRCDDGRSLNQEISPKNIFVWIFLWEIHGLNIQFRDVHVMARNCYGNPIMIKSLLKTTMFLLQDDCYTVHSGKFL